MKVAVLYNRDSRDVINLFGTPNREKVGLGLIKRICDSLKEGGHQPQSFEVDKNLITRLESFMPRVLSGERPGMAFNISYGVQGQARYTHAPSILEMVGLPYVGSGPVAHSIALDKVYTKMLLVQQGLPTPEFVVLENRHSKIPKLTYPVIVKPKHEAVSFGIKVVHNKKELEEAALAIFDMFDQSVLVERYIDGREVNVGLLGNSPPEALPPVDLKFGKGEKVYSYEDKTGKSGRTIQLQCPAKLTTAQLAHAQEIARKAFSVIGCADCARVDMRMDKKGKLYILEINSLPSLGPRGSFVRAAETAGLDFTGLVNRLVDVASARYFGSPHPPVISAGDSDPGAAVFEYLTRHRDKIEKRLAELVSVNSRTGDPIGVGRLRDRFAEHLHGLGMKRVDALSDDRSALTYETNAGMGGGLLLVAHLDVPLPPHTTAQGFRREPEWLVGEGVGSSRAGLVSLDFALRALRSQRLLRKRPIGVLLYCDEGREARYSAEILAQAFKRCKHALVLRPGNQPEAVIHQRRGQRTYQLVAEAEPQRPGKAHKKPDLLAWLGKRLNQISGLSARKERVSASCVDIHSESYPMLLPHRVTARLMVTYMQKSAADAVEKRMRELLGTRDVKWDLQLIIDRPPQVDRPRNRRLLKSLHDVATRWDIPLSNESSVWPSVAGLAPASTATVCGVGPVARNLYTPHEAVQRISLMRRTLLLAQFMLQYGE
ncbi:MAG TPA: ATP-grasp domain-containing protein [candidate division Zixibacteria bacterium]|nr:ATP-grasp domain-containing protein [candidate division Zixibacteria bacterium]